MAGSIKLNDVSGSITLQTSNPTDNYTVALPNGNAQLRGSGKMVCLYTLATNTAPASAVGTTWTTYPINSVEYNDTDCTLNSNTLSLSAGLYEVTAHFTCGGSAGGTSFRFSTSTGKQFRGITNGSRGYPINSNTGLSFIVSESAAFTMTAQYWASSASANGLGYPTNDGTNEVYARIVITKLS